MRKCWNVLEVFEIVRKFEKVLDSVRKFKSVRTCWKVIESVA